MAIVTEIFKARTDHEGEYAQYNTPADRIVVVDGVEYDNHPGGTVAARQTSYGTKVFSTHHVGLVVATREQNWYDDSDFYALCWNPETKSLDHITYGTTRFGGTDDNGAAADLADEYKADYAEFLTRQEEANILRTLRADWFETVNDLLVLRRGDEAVVVKGRKVAIGTTGTIIWTGQSAYGDRVGIKDAAGEVHWTAATNVKKIIDVDDIPAEIDFIKTPEIRRAAAEARIAHGLRSYLRAANPGMMVVA